MPGGMILKIGVPPIMLSESGVGWRRCPAYKKRPDYLMTPLVGGMMFTPLPTGMNTPVCVVETFETERTPSLIATELTKEGKLKPGTAKAQAYAPPAAGASGPPNSIQIYVELK